MGYQGLISTFLDSLDCKCGDGSPGGGGWFDLTPWYKSSLRNTLTVPNLSISLSSFTFRSFYFISRQLYCQMSPSSLSSVHTLSMQTTSPLWLHLNSCRSNSAPLQSEFQAKHQLSDQFCPLSSLLSPSLLLELPGQLMVWRRRRKRRRKCPSEDPWFHLWGPWVETVLEYEHKFKTYMFCPFLNLSHKLGCGGLDDSWMMDGRGQRTRAIIMTIQFLTETYCWIKMLYVQV